MNTPNRNAIAACLGLGACLAAAFSVGRIARSDANRKLPRAMWVWDSGSIANADTRNELFDFSARKGVSRLFLDTGSAFESPERAVASRHPVSLDALATFLREAHARGLKVDGLDGDPQLALTANHPGALATLQRVLDYNRDAAPAARLDGWQWDIEPYVLPEFKAGGKAQRDLLRQYLDLVAKIRNEVSSATRSGDYRFALGFAIPWWTDTDEHAVDWNGATKPATYQLMDALNSLPDSYLAIMSYRNTAAGPNGTIAIVTRQIDYAAANAPRLRLWIGQETGEAKNDPASITFYGKSEAVFDTALAIIDTRFATTPVVAGIAIHHWKSYMRLADQPTGDAAGFNIAYPPANSAMPGSAKVNGTAPPALGASVTVEVMPVGDIFYPQGACPVADNGAWFVAARFGNASTPAGRAFVIRATLKDANGKILAVKEVGVTRG